MTADFEAFHFNTAVAATMELVNDTRAFIDSLGGRDATRVERAAISEAVENLVLLLSPMVPHIAEELWEKSGGGGSVFEQSWPTFDELAAAEDVVTVAVQVNGKLRGEVEAERGASRTRSSSWRWPTNDPEARRGQDGPEGDTRAGQDPQSGGRLEDGAGRQTSEERHHGVQAHVARPRAVRGPSHTFRPGESRYFESREHIPAEFLMDYRFRAESVPDEEAFPLTRSSRTL